MKCPGIETFNPFLCLINLNWRIFLITKFGENCLDLEKAFKVRKYFLREKMQSAAALDWSDWFSLLMHIHHNLQNVHQSKQFGDVDFWFFSVMPFLAWVPSLKKTSKEH